MGILDLLIHLEAMGCVFVAKDKATKSVVYGLDERGKTPKQVSNLERRVLRVLRPHKELLLRFLAPMQEEHFYSLTTGGKG